MTVEATGRMSTDESTVGVRRVATELAVLLSRGDVRGFIRLVRPSSFEELCAEERIIRDSESSGVCGRCGAVAYGWRCEVCAAAHRADTNRRRDELRAVGRCIFCGEVAPCSQGCDNRSRVRINELRRRRRVNGLCERCGHAAVAGGLCAEHRAELLPLAAEREAKKRAQRRAAGLCVALRASISA